MGLYNGFCTPLVHFTKWRISIILLLYLQSSDNIKTAQTDSNFATIITYTMPVKRTSENRTAAQSASYRPTWVSPLVHSYTGAPLQAMTTPGKPDAKSMTTAEGESPLLSASPTGITSPTTMVLTTDSVIAMAPTLSTTGGPSQSTAAGAILKMTKDIKAVLIESSAASTVSAQPTTIEIVVTSEVTPEGTPKIATTQADTDITTKGTTEFINKGTTLLISEGPYESTTKGPTAETTRYVTGTVLGSLPVITNLVSTEGKIDVESLIKGTEAETTIIMTAVSPTGITTFTKGFKEESTGATTLPTAISTAASTKDDTSLFVERAMPLSSKGTAKTVGTATEDKPDSIVFTTRGTMPSTIYSTMTSFTEADATSVSRPSAIPTLMSKPSAIPTLVSTPSAIPTSVSRPSAIPTLVSRASAIPTLVSTPSAIPTSVSRPLAIPTLVSRPSEIPTSVTRTSAIRTSVSRASAIPTLVSRASAIPTSVSRPSEIQTLISRPSAIPTSMSRPSEIPTSLSRISAIPTSLNRPLVIPTSSTGGKTLLLTEATTMITKNGANTSSEGVVVESTSTKGAPSFIPDSISTSCIEGTTTSQMGHTTENAYFNSVVATEDIVGTTTEYKTEGSSEASSAISTDQILYTTTKTSIVSTTERAQKSSAEITRENNGGVNARSTTTMRKSDETSALSAIITVDGTVSKGSMSLNDSIQRTIESITRLSKENTSVPPTKEGTISLVTEGAAMISTNQPTATLADMKVTRSIQELTAPTAITTSDTTKLQEATTPVTLESIQKSAPDGDIFPDMESSVTQNAVDLIEQYKTGSTATSTGDVTETIGIATTSDMKESVALPTRTTAGIASTGITLLSAEEGFGSTVADTIQVLTSTPETNVKVTTVIASINPSVLTLQDTVELSIEDTKIQGATTKSTEVSTKDKAISIQVTSVTSVSMGITAMTTEVASDDGTATEKKAPALGGANFPVPETTVTSNTEAEKRRNDDLTTWSILLVALASACGTVLACMICFGCIYRAKGSHDGTTMYVVKEP